jgi:hypothetical protein
MPTINMTLFEYDALDRLTGETDALVRTTSLPTMPCDHWHYPRGSHDDLRVERGR